jgi:hypothetical protein
MVTMFVVTTFSYYRHNEDRTQTLAPWNSQAGDEKNE